MEIPNLITRLTGGDVPPREYFFALEISQQGVKSAIWSLVNRQVHVLSTGSAVIWEGKDPKDLVQAADTSFSVAIQNLKEATQNPPRKIVFGLPIAWVDGEKIRQEYQQFLKEIAQKLELKPVGFAVTTEALVHYLKTSEGVPPSVILVGIEEMNISVTLAHLGQIVGTQTVARSVSLGEDLEEGLSRFQVKDVLPSRMLLYDSEANLEEAKQHLLDRPWQDKLPFLHFPKVDILPHDFSIKAISLSAGGEFAKLNALQDASPQTLSPAETPNTVAPPLVEVEDEESLPDVSAQSLGFIEGEDIAESSFPPPIQRQEPSAQPASLPVSPPRPRFRLKLPHFKLPSLPSRPHFPALSTAVLIAIFLSVSLAGAYWYLPKATVTITVEPKILEKQLEITADSGSQLVDAGAKTIPSAVLALEVEGKKNTAATGQKTVGERSKGEVTFYNDTPQTKVVPSGTVLTSPSGSTFTLDVATNIASKSGTADLSEPGKATAKVTASNIGEQYNLAGNTTFKVGVFSPADLVAKNSLAISGGTSRQVKAVSKKDLENLEKELTGELSSQVKDELGKSLAEDQVLIDSSLAIKSASAQYDKKAGDEGDQINLTLKIKASALTFASKDLTQIAESELLESVPEGYQLPKNDLRPSFDILGEKDGKTQLKVSFSVNLLPRLSIDAIRKDITGKNQSSAENILKSLPGFKEATIKMRPNFLKSLPHIPKNIQIIIKSNQ